MVDHPLTLMAVFAHPDDEVWMAPALAKYSDMGVRTVLVTATLGEEGKIVDPNVDPDAVREHLGEIREREIGKRHELSGFPACKYWGIATQAWTGLQRIRIVATSTMRMRRRQSAGSCASFGANGHM